MIQSPTTAHLLRSGLTETAIALPYLATCDSQSEEYGISRAPHEQSTQLGNLLGFFAGPWTLPSGAI